MTQSVLITGAAQGIGAGIAERLAKDSYDIAISDLEQQRSKAETVLENIKSTGRNWIFIPLDVTDPVAVKKAVDLTATTFGTFDVMINNAGVAKVDTVTDIDPNDLKFSFEINVFGVVYGIQAAANKFKELKKPGKIINASSIAGLKAFPVWGTYSDTKAAVVSFTQAAAKELAPDHITVNAYAPGVVGTTGMWDEIDAKMSKINGKPIGQNRDEFVNQVPLGRTVEPEDVVNLVSFLASAESSYIDGQALAVDGGMM